MRDLITSFMAPWVAFASFWTEWHEVLQITSGFCAALTIVIFAVSILIREACPKHDGTLTLFSKIRVTNFDGHFYAGFMIILVIQQFIYTLRRYDNFMVGLAVLSSDVVIVSLLTFLLGWSYSWWLAHSKVKKD